MKNTMADLRNHLFEVLERLKDPDPATPMDVPTAESIVNVAKTLIDSARVENEYIGLKLKQYPNGMPENQVERLGGWMEEKK